MFFLSANAKLSNSIQSSDHMEVHILPILRHSCFIEILSLMATVRFIWAQFLPTKYSTSKLTLLLVYFVTHRKLSSKALLHRIEECRNVPSIDIPTVMNNQKQMSDLIFQYNVLNSHSRWLSWVLCAVVVGAALFYNPLLLVSVLVSDLITTRIHQHLIHSLYLALSNVLCTVFTAPSSRNGHHTCDHLMYLELLRFILFLSWLRWMDSIVRDLSSLRVSGLR